ncbi:tripartite tricarboxylate transporter substrate-binding protein [Nitratireductor aquibiodomus]|uniref:tripartite tricarboxylate transporter substrate-binding protein n=1 Tax=Nitratireductor aquibiodomus TaxID=204799 RepID=UPI000B067D86|nr:tripartite tricarboxylate transporter substrate-binding protein [Nitratireductor aquibiodomus]
MKRTIVSAVALAATAWASAAYAACDWKPERPVSVIVPWGAGGTTDTNTRQLATMLQQKFDVPFNVVNRTGGNGVVGHSAISRAKPDGYTIGAATVEMNTMHWFGLTDLTYRDITPIALINQPSASVLVSKDSPFGSLKELLDHARENPGELTASGTALGGIWHLALAACSMPKGLKPRPSAGSPPRGRRAHCRSFWPVVSTWSRLRFWKERRLSMPVRSRRLPI